MFTFDLRATPLSDEETARFADCLDRHGVDDAIWGIYDSLLSVSSSVSRPLVLRAYDGDDLAGAAVVIRCTAYGRSLFGNPLLHVPMDIMGIPAYIWMRVGFCPEAAANPGFVAAGYDEETVVAAMIDFLRGHAQSLFITDTTANASLHPHAKRFPYVYEGAVDVSYMNDEKDYLKEHRNIKGKVRSFRNKGGTIDAVTGTLCADIRRTVRCCVRSTMRASPVRGPFQDIFVDVVSRTCELDSSKTVHLIARMNGEFLGYHSFVRTGDCLRMMHGAFDRRRRTTFHAYENLMIGTVGYAIENGLKTVHFGPVMNETKRRMMNVKTDTSLYFYARNPLLRAGFAAAFPYTNMQHPKLLAFGAQADPHAQDAHS